MNSPEPNANDPSPSGESSIDSDAAGAADPDLISDTGTHAAPDADALAEYLPIYLDETDEQLDDLVETLLVLEQQPGDKDSLSAAFRLLHSIKGASGMLGLDQITTLTHHLETRFERLRSGKTTLDRSTMNLTLRCVDFLRDCNEQLRSGDPLPVAEALLGQLRQLESETAAEEDRQQRSESKPAAPPEVSDLVSEITSMPPEQFAQGKIAQGPIELGKVEVGKVAEEPIENSRSVSESAAASSGDRQPDQTGDGDREPDGNDALDGDSAIDGNEPTPQTYHLVLRFGDELDREAAVQLANQSVDAAAGAGAILATRPEREDFADQIDHSLDIIVQTTLSPDQLIDLTEHRSIQSLEVRVPREPDTDPLAVRERSVTQSQSAEAKVETEPMRAESMPAESEPASVPSPEPAPEPAPEPPVAPEVVAPPVVPPVVASGRTAATAPPKVNETMRVDLQRLDELMNLAGELVVNRAQFVQVAEDVAGDSPAHGRHSPWAARLDEAVDRLTRVSDSLQRGVLGTRMVPVGPLLGRFKRVVRDLTDEVDKDIDLVITGDSTELDKRMIDALGDPLMHLIRNSVDHGIETKSDRIAAGKPPRGTIRLSADHSGNKVSITIADDGGGIDVRRIREKLVQKGLATSSAAAAMPVDDVIDSIFMPGFSTAASVTDISGRGVGMDIVRSRIGDLSGEVSVQSEAGQGTTFTITLPLTLAIVGSLLIQIGEVTFGIPTDGVREIVSVDRDRIETVGGRPMFDVRGQYLPMFEIDEIFDWHCPPRSSTKDTRSSTKDTRGSTNDTRVSTAVQIVVLQSGQTRLGLRVDRAIGSRDVVIKSLSDHLTAIAGLAGATILGDGQVALMLDVGSLRTLTRSLGGSLAGSSTGGSEATAT